ncbi:Gfo/Idh/MocA family oxidoreductase [Sandarakinorhabdus sp.]|uniref:Gfo/Idh/MocA family protein n=1 Tax=Sandarakinorhabdus sp. TaxID=1916663 RepID=UPI003342D352
MRWAIWGTGAISARFVAGLADVPGARASIVASRDSARAEAFARSCGITGHIGGNDLAAVAAALAAAADVVYIATPTGLHAAHAEACLAAGLHVLVEKPLASTGADAQALADAAQRHGRFLMEALWTRHLPATRALTDAVAGLGEIRLITGGFAAVNHIDPALPRFQAAAGGGALRLYGVYPLALGQMLAGRAAAISAAGHRIGDLDASAAMTVRYASGAVGQFHCSLECGSDNEFVVHCTGGHAALIGPLFRPTGVRVVRSTARSDMEQGRAGVAARLRASPIGNRLVQWRQHGAGLAGQRLAAPYAGNGYGAQAAELQRCVNAGMLESPLMPLADSIELAQLIDQAGGCIANAGLPGAQRSVPMELTI